MPSTGHDRARYVPDSSLRAPADDDRVALLPAAGDDGSPGYTTVSQIGSGGGGGSAGSPIVRKFAFAFDTANLLTGADMYTPTIGDILLDAWIEIDTAWDGTTPRGDVGNDLAGSGGWFTNFSAFGEVINMAQADAETNSAGLLTQHVIGHNGQSSSLLTAILAGVTDPAIRFLPAKFVATNPIEVVVSQDGTNTGADPGSTQGAAVLYLVTVTPV